MSGLNDAFGYFGAKGKNARWSWSARSPDGRTVVVTVWKDILRQEDGRWTYDDFNRSDRALWGNKLGNHERLENLQWALKNCGGLVRVVITTAREPSANPRAIAACHPHKTSS